MLIEEIVRDYIKSNSTMPVYLEDIKKPPEHYYLIERTSGSRSKHLNYATFAIQSYGDSQYNAAKHNESLKNILEKICELPEIAKIELNNDYNFTDTVTKRYRYQLVCEITYY